MWEQKEWQPMWAVGAIWAAVVAISVFSPDLVSGSEQERLPIAAFGTWIWGAVATRSVLTTLLRRIVPGWATGVGDQLAGVITAIWMAAAAVSIFGPQLITGSDPTRLPLAAMVAPIAATVLTTGACEVAAAFAASSRRH